MDRRERLLTLTLTLLHTPRPLRAEELREQVPGYEGIDQDAAFRRAFERDKEALREMGVPIEIQPIFGSDPPQDGYRIPADEYYLDAPELEPDELAALRLAATAVRVGDLEGTEALLRLGGLEGNEDPGAMASSGQPLVLPVPQGLDDLFAAVANRSRVQFGYKGQQRTVDPYRLDFLRGRWYLSGFDHTRDALRVYRVDRMAGARAVGPAGVFDNAGDAKPGTPAQPWRFDVDEPVVALLWVDAVQAPWVRTELGEAAVFEGNDDGSMLARVEVRNREAFRSFVLGLLDHAVLLEPEELRRDVIEWLEAMA